MRTSPRPFKLKARAIDPKVRALALASYEDGELESVFRAILTAPQWDFLESPLLKCHSLISFSGLEHIKFDSDPEQGTWVRFVATFRQTDRMCAPLWWKEFKQMFVKAAPRLTGSH